MAVERYRLAHQNALPEALSQLTPRFLAAVPVDPFDGKPLRYKKGAAGGYVVYSVAKDGQDDGGKPKPPNTQDGAPYDLTFAIQR